MGGFFERIDMSEEKDKDQEVKWLSGAKTFRFMRVRPEKSQRTHDLKDRASNRMVELFRKGIYGDRLARPMKRRDPRDEQVVQNQAEFARLPAATRVKVLKCRREDLEDELRNIEYNSSQIARTFHMPDILRRLDEINKEIRRLEEEADKEI